MLEERAINLWAYNLETILAEKLQTILARDVFNTRMRDFYDVYALLNSHGSQVDNHILSEAFIATSEKRNSEWVLETYESRIDNIAANDDLNKLWKQYQRKYIYASEIKFEDVIDSVKELLNRIQ